MHGIRHKVLVSWIKRIPNRSTMVVLGHCGSNIDVGHVLGVCGTSQIKLLDVRIQWSILILRSVLPPTTGLIYHMSSFFRTLSTRDAHGKFLPSTFEENMLQRAHDQLSQAES